LSDSVFDPGLDAVPGVRAEFKVVQGLSFGFTLPVPALTPLGDMITAVVEQKPPVESSAKPIGDVFGNLIFGARYEAPVVTVVAALGLHPAVENGPDSYVDVIAGVEVPLDPVNVILDARIDSRNNDVGETGYIRIAPLVRFTSGPLAAHVRGDISIPSGKGDVAANGGGGTRDPTEEAATSIGFRVGAEYAVLEGVSPYLQVGSDNVGYLDGNGLYIQPGVNFTVGSCSIGVFDKIDKIGADDTTTRKGITNQFQIDFKWSF
jgi:hypothetical protein